MKKIILIVILLPILAFGQKIKVLDGTVKNLKGISQFDLIFDYSDVSIPHYESEELFLAAKVALREKKEKGSGLLFREKWFANRKEIYEPMFIQSFDRWYNKKGKTTSSKADYVINIKITNIFTGYNVIAINQHGKISAIFTVYKKSNPNIILFKGQVDNVKGGKSYDLAKRMAITYFYLAKKTAIYIKRKS